MRLQTELGPAGGPGATWRTTPDTVMLADQLAHRLRGFGYDVQRLQDSNDGADSGGGPAGPGVRVREDVYQELDLGGGEGIGMAVLDGGAYVSADAWHDEPQRFWVSMVRLLATVESATGWATEDRADILAAAAAYSVRPDGSVARPAQIDSDELADRAREVAQWSAQTVDRPRPLDLSRPPLPRIAAVAGELAQLGLPAFVIELESDPGSSGMGAPGLSPEDQTRLDDQLDELLELAGDLHAVLGDERTGRIGILRVHVADGRARLEPVFDRVPLNERGRLQLGWEGLVHDMLRRDPEWQPAWLPELRELLLFAGQDV